MAGGAAAFLTSLWVGAAGTGGWPAGWALTWKYFSQTLPQTYTTRFVYPLTDNQALTTLFARLLGDVPLSRLLGFFAVGLVICITCILLLRRPASPPDPAVRLPELALVSLLPLLVISWVLSNYFVMALPALAVGVGSLAPHSPWLAAPRLKLCLVAYLLMSISSYSGGSHMPLFYFVPFGLAGMLILWGMLIYIEAETKKPGHLAGLVSHALCIFKNRV